MSGDDKRKISCNLTPELYAEMIQHWDWGFRDKILNRLVELGLEATKKHGKGIIGLIMNGDVELKPTKTAIQKLNQEV